MGVDPSLLPSNKSWQDKTKWPQAAPGEVQIGYLEYFLHDRVVRHQHRLPREMVESPFLEVFKRCVDVMQGDTVQWWPWQCYGNGWTG